MNVVSLFSGAGGMDIGFIKKGFDVIWANDFFDDAIISYKKNIGSHIIKKDIRKVKSSEIPNDIDVVIGGFPCQGFSIGNNKRSINDERNFLYLEMLRIIKDKKPKFFIAENVKGLLSLANGKVLKMILNDFKKIGYDVDYKLLNAAEYGIPQARERVIIMGNRIGKKNVFPQKTHYINNRQLGLEKAETVKETIGFLKEVEPTKKVLFIDGMKICNHIASDNVSEVYETRKHEVDQKIICEFLRKHRNNSSWTNKTINEHFGYKHTAGHWFRNDKYGSIPSPKEWWELKKILKFDDTYDRKVTETITKEKVFDQSLRITKWNKPSATITGGQPAIHINKKRRLSARECALLQTFPMEYEFYGSLSSIYQQIGNAVPCKLAERIATEVKKQLI